jgi:hypothetical protein
MIKEEKTKNENPNFRLKPVAEFLDGNHHFYIPSYQRGYRWNKKQVEDLLKDIGDFAENAQKGDFYCLQPVVVKSKQWKNEKKETIIGWEVIDGQQRLTTLWLLLEYLKQGSRTPFVIKSILHDINYETREKLDLSNPNKNKNIDEFYVFQARSVIRTWFEDREGKVDVDYSAFEKVLFNNNQEIPQVKFIWYVVENNDDLNSIKVFNNLNKGKIRLTNAELIKALFILNANNTMSNINEVVLEWDLIESSLHDDQFWLFLANKDYNPATRIDLIFDFLTDKPSKGDDDFSYRKFQTLYDGEQEQCWKTLGVANLNETWEKVKAVYQLFLYWFENNKLYHYIGYLLTIGVSYKKIYNRIHALPKNKMREEVKAIIRERIGVSKTELDELSYGSDKISSILLLFNIESGANSNSYRFPFDLYKNEKKWDVEHIASQTTNKMQRTEDKKAWLTYLKQIVCHEEGWSELLDKAMQLLEKLDKEGKEGEGEFNRIYEEVFAIIEPEDEHAIDKDSIVNLALLDAGTNRSYGNAPFQTKRQRIIEKDKKGKFVPTCTRNVFLKYYTAESENASQWKNAWTETDGKAYLKEMHETIDDLLTVK